jgi:hypothetical protein
MKKLIGIVGFIGSGKDTIGNYLVDNYQFQSMSFAATLKDAVSSIFGFSREMIQGSTAESRSWRELPDPYWSEKMGRPMTPRHILQKIGTDILRTHFSDNIWIWSLENNLAKTEKSVVITDCRFDNEIDMIHKLGGEVWWVQRGQMPEWYDVAVNAPSHMSTLYSKIHITEYTWLQKASKQANIIQNNSTLENLYAQIDEKLK